MNQAQSREHIGRFYDFLKHAPYGVTEVRVIGTDGSISVEYFDNREAFINACAGESGRGQVYASIHPCPRNFMDRSRNILDSVLRVECVKSSDFEYVTAIVIDLDPERPDKKVSPSTDDEMRLAIDRAPVVVQHLVEEGICNEGEPQIVMSGNGCHILIPIPPIPVTNDNREELTAKRREFQHRLIGWFKNRFSDGLVDMDAKIYNNTVTKVIGTQSVKARPTPPDRPNRISYPVTDLQRHESASLRKHILDLVIPDEVRVAAPSQVDVGTDIPIDTTDLDMDDPCDMCSPARDLWMVDSVDDRSTDTFVMMQVLLVKGVPPGKAMGYIRYYDRKLGRNDSEKWIRNIYNKVAGSRRLPCKWLQENGYCHIDTVDCMFPHRSRTSYKKVPRAPYVLPTISLKEARRNLVRDVDSISMDGAPSTYLIAYPAGVGKTHNVARHVREQGWKVLWLCPTHKHAQEIIDSHMSCMRVAHLRSRGHMIENDGLDCTNSDLIRRLQSEAPDATGAVCRGCAKIRDESCAYFIQFNDAKNATVIMGVHDHIQSPDFLEPYAQDMDCIVIDEWFADHYRTETSFNASDMELAIEILESIGSDESLRDAADCLIGYIRDILSRTGPAFTIERLPAIDQALRKAYENERMRRYHAMIANVNPSDSSNQVRNIVDVLDILTYISSDGGAISKQRDTYKYVRRSWLPVGKNLIILDASGSSEFYETLLGRPVITYGEDCHIDCTARVTQFLDGEYPLTSLIIPSKGRTGSYGNVMKLIVAIKEAHESSRIVIGCIKKVEDLFRVDALEDDRTDIIHYRAVRGIDEFKDRDVLILVGYPMIGYRDMAEKTRIMFGLNWDDRDAESQMQNDAKVYRSPCYYKDGYGYEVETFQFSDPHISQYYQHVVIQEMVQMIGRIRPYERPCEGSDKHIYIICSIPLPDLRIDDMLTRDEFMSRLGHERGRRREMRDIRDVIWNLSRDTFTIVELGAALGRDSKSQRDHLRDILMDREERGNQCFLGSIPPQNKRGRTFTRVTACRDCSGYPRAKR